MGVEFVLVVGGHQDVLAVGFVAGDLIRAVMVCALALLLFGPVGVSEADEGVLQRIPPGYGVIGLRGGRDQRWGPPGPGGAGAGGFS